jgi:hypothetical protein
VKFLKSELCSVRPEVEVNKAVRALNIEFFSARLVPRVKELVRVLKMEFFSARLELLVTEAVGCNVQALAAPACNVQDTGVVVDA